MPQQGPIPAILRLANLLTEAPEEPWNANAYLDKLAEDMRTAGDSIRTTPKAMKALKEWNPEIREKTDPELLAYRLLVESVEPRVSRQDAQYLMIQVGDCHKEVGNQIARFATRLDRPDPRRNARGKWINERMLAKIQKEPEALYWSANMWANHLNCAASTVKESITWKKVCLPAREEERNCRRGRRLRGPRKLGRAQLSE
jgi:hypothetical protein